MRTVTAQERIKRFISDATLSDYDHETDITPQDDQNVQLPLCLLRFSKALDKVRTNGDWKIEPPNNTFDQLLLTKSDEEVWTSMQAGIEASSNNCKERPRTWFKCAWKLDPDHTDYHHKIQRVRRVSDPVEHFGIRILVFIRREHLPMLEGWNMTRMKRVNREFLRLLPQFKEVCSIAEAKVLKSLLAGKKLELVEDEFETVRDIVNAAREVE
ncbi:hypothetical protein G7Y89_g8808 [Cudoniella acicularis]|uniref:Uncharacterized protein n=1 Tax=Cudoniella acicularis TaxID=354080 RepID=A0A8H4RHH6_9HELO|nr:hypothetical protein G7Y89_g8808 [Cudoniella acicularis]